MTDTPFQDIAEQIYTIAKEHGFWEDNSDRNFGEMIALAHSELSEALEEHRNGSLPVYFNADRAVYPYGQAKIAKPEGVAVELADTIIRCLDTLYSVLRTSSAYTIDDVIRMKMEYNKNRPYKHGKKSGY